MTKTTSSKFSFVKPAVYKIKVLGDLNASWTERLGGLQINVQKSGDKGPVSMLIGQMNDPAALSGVLNTLYENHLTIISVNLLMDSNE
jgi:hypothetical protein